MRNRRPARSAVAAAAVAGLLGAAPPPLSAAAVRPPATRSGSPWATAADRRAGTAPASSVTFRMYLAPRDPAGEAATAAAVSDPANRAYHHYLTPAQVRRRFAPAGRHVTAVRAWLGTRGFTVDDVPANNAFVEATGSAVRVERAFDVTLGEYAVGGRMLRAADHAPSLPRSLSRTVSAVIGIDQSAGSAPPGGGTAPGLVAPPAGSRHAAPCGVSLGQRTDAIDPAFPGRRPDHVPCGYTPGQLRAAYGIDKTVSDGVDGRGTTVAIVDAFASPTLYLDAAAYAQREDPAHPLLVSRFTERVAAPTPGEEGPYACDAAAWHGEQAMDVEAVHAMAPGAEIHYIGGADCSDEARDASINEVVAARSADLISDSFDDDGQDVSPDTVRAFDQIAEQAATEGIGIYFASGDHGDEVASRGRARPDFVASDPWVTAVGGTGPGVDGDDSAVFRTGGESGIATLPDAGGPAAAFRDGSGGGTSTSSPEPADQRGVLPASLAARGHGGGPPGRVVPDISMGGDTTAGMLIGYTRTFPDGVHYGRLRAGGTGLSCALLAGMMADSDQLDGFHHGFVNPLLYRYPAVGTPAGHDPAAGLGVPDGLLFLLLP